MVRQDTHVTRSSSDIHLSDIFRGEDGLKTVHEDEFRVAFAGDSTRTWWGRTNESLSLSATSAYPRFDKAIVEGVRRAAEESRRRADMAVVSISLPTKFRAFTDSLSEFQIRIHP